MDAPRADRGRFVWHDLLSTDPEASAAFYAELFGWEVTEMPMIGVTYRLLSVGDRDIGGIVPFDPTLGGRSYWLAYVTADDVDGTARKAAELGATIRVQPTDMQGVGRFAVVLDPQGAVIQPICCLDPPPPDGELEPGDVCWNELLTPDPAAAATFYSALFGWAALAADVAGRPYRLWKRGGKRAAGARLLPPELSGPTWVFYVLVADVDASAARAAELGATLVNAPSDAAGLGRVALATDPSGALFAMLGKPKTAAPAV
jgi:predicted enzyme related to lactoylglutathione lyase